MPDGWYHGESFVGGPLALREWIKATRVQVGGWSAGGHASNIDAWGLGGILTQVTDVTSSAVVDARGVALRQDTSAVIDNFLQVRAGFEKGTFGALPIMFHKFALVDLTDIRFWSVNTSNIAITPLGDDPAVSLFGLRFSTSAPDTNFQFATKDGTTLNLIDTGIPGDTAVHYLLTRLTADGVFFELYDSAFELEAQAFTAVNLPASASNYFFQHSLTTLAAAVKSLDQFAAMYANVGV